MASDVRIWTGSAWESIKGTNGAPGPSAVSTNAGQLAKLGTDNLVLVSSADLDSRYVNVAGDTMTGPLLAGGGRSLFTANNEPFSVGVRRSAAGGYVYFGATDVTATPGLQLSLASGGAALTISNTNNITSTGTAHSFVANSIPIAAVNGAVNKAGDTMTGQLVVNPAVGPAAPDGSIQVIGDNTNASITVQRNSTDNLNGAFRIKKSRGTAAAPLSVVANDFLGGLVIHATRNDNTYATAGAIQSVCTRTPAVGETAVPMEFRFQVTNTAATGNTVALRLHDLGADIAGNISSTGTAHTFAANSIQASAIAGLPAATAPSTTAGLADTASGTVGTSALYSRADHTHPLPAIPAASTVAGLADSAAGSVGTSAAYARADHTHPGLGMALYTASKVLDASDIGKMIINYSTGATAVTFTLPGDAVMPVGTKIEFYDGSKTAITFLSPQAGQSLTYSSYTASGTAAGTAVNSSVTITTGSLRMASPYSRLTAIKTQANLWVLFSN